MSSNFHTHIISENKNINEMVSIKADFPISLLPQLYSLEFHPWYLNLTSLDNIPSNILNNAAAIGEIGLDAQKGPSLDIQINAFNKLLFIANNLNKPIIIHNVGCTGELFDSLKQYPKLKVLIHGFIGKVTRLDEYLKRGYYVSLHPLALEKYDLSSYIKGRNLENIGFETDDDATLNITQVIEKASSLLDIPNLETITDLTFETLFNRKQ